MSSRNPLQQLRRLDGSSPNFHDHISNILHEEEYKRWVSNVQDDDLVGIVNYLDEILDTLDPSSSTFRRCLRELRHICGTRTILPTSYTFSSQRLGIGHRPVASGGSGDVYEGTLDGSKVCVKRVRVYSRDGQTKSTKTLYQETVVWKRLKHRNIVPLLGITPDPLQLISEWMSGGDLSEYITKHPRSDRLSFLSDVAAGLHYLHSRNVIHGDLKGPNVLVDSSGCARITDFGLATVTKNLDSIRSAVGDKGHTARWTAPEILNDEGTYSKEADIFSFAMVMIEVFTGAVPFHSSLPAAAMLAIMAGERPPRPTHQALTNELWMLIQRCWNQDYHLRPEISEVLQVLNGRQPPPIVPSVHRTTSPSTVTLGQQHLRETTQDRSGDRRGGQPNGNISRRQSRRNAGQSEPLAPMPTDHGQFNPSEPQTSLARNKVYDHAGGAGESRTDLQNILGGRKASKRDARGKGSRIDLSHDLEENNEGEYWRGGRQKSHGASCSVLNVGDGYYQGSQSRNTSRVNLPSNAPQDLGQHSQSRTDQVGGGRNTPRYDLQTGAQPRNQSRVDMGGTRPEDERRYGPGARQDSRGVSRDGYYQSGSNQNPSRAHLPNNSSRDNLGQFNKSRTNLYDGRRAGSHSDLLTTGDGSLSRQTSRRDATATNTGYVTGGVSRYGSQNETRSRLNLDETLIEDQGSPHELRTLTQLPGRQTSGGPRGNRDQEAKNTPGDVLGPPPWKRLTRKSITAYERASLITAIFSDHNKVELPKYLSQEDAQTFINMVDEVMNGLAPQVHRKFLHAVYRICGRQSLVPQSLEIPLCYDPNEQPVCRGGFADVWKGRYCGKDVAAKVLRLRRKDDTERIRRSFCKEVVGWKTLSHPNVLPLLGVTTTNDRLVMVSEWMTNGNINGYVEANPDADRLELLRDVSRGLVYMHDRGIIHGDLKGANILIDNSGRACLADFSLLTIASDQQTMVTSCIEGGTIQWMSPELLYPERFGLKKSRPTKESDCYALGMVVYEVLSGQIPFHPSAPFTVIGKVLEGKRPVRLKGEGGRLFTDAIWRLLELSWEEQPCDRPKAKAVLSCLEGNPPSVWLAPNVDKNSGVGGGNESDAVSSDSDPPPLQPPPSAAVNAPTSRVAGRGGGKNNFTPQPPRLTPPMTIPPVPNAPQPEGRERICGCC